MTPIGNEPCPVAMAKQRARAAVTLGAVSFVAVGALAWIGLDAVRGPANSTTASASGPALVLTQSDGTQKALISRAEREIAAARQAILKSAGTNLELLDLSEVEQLTDNTRQKDPRIEAARLAILQNAGRNLELLDLNEVEELIGFTPRVRQPATATTELAAATQVQPEPDLDLGLEEIRSLAVDGGLQPSAAPEEAVVVSNLAPTSATVAAAGTDCIADLREFAGQQSILFSSGSAELQGSELPTLRKIGRMAEACDGALIHVTGHSDSSGSDVINLALSWQRADNTVATLAALGVDTSKFEPVGFGARSPSAQGDSSDEELNRRVEFVVFEEVNHSQ